MRVNCPKCSGNNRRNIQECYLSKTVNYIPGFIIEKMKAGTSFKQRLLLAGILVAGDYFADKTGKKSKYKIYQCPSCGTRIAFAEYEGTEGLVRERLGDDLDD